MHTAFQPEHSIYWELSSRPNTQSRKGFPVQRPRSQADQARIFAGTNYPSLAGPSYRHKTSSHHHEYPGGGRHFGDDDHSGDGNRSEYSGSREGSAANGQVLERPKVRTPGALSMSLSRSRGRSSSTEPSTPQGWVRQRYFDKPAYKFPKTQVPFAPSIHYAGSEDLQRAYQAEVAEARGRPPSVLGLGSTLGGTTSSSRLGMSTTRPATSAGSTMRKSMTLTDSGYLQELQQRSVTAMEGRLMLTLTKEEKARRKNRTTIEDAEAVHALATPKGGKREQLFEEVLRQLQGDGPMERLQARLKNLDTEGRGKVTVGEFKEVLLMSDLKDKHVNYLVQMAGTERRASQVSIGGGQQEVPYETLVNYAVFLEILRLARNRKMANLQRAREIQKKGLMRWQFRQVVRLINAWKELALRAHIRKTTGGGMGRSRSVERSRSNSRPMTAGNS